MRTRDRQARRLPLAGKDGAIGFRQVAEIILRINDELLQLA